MIGAVTAALLGTSKQSPATWDLTVTTTDVNQTYTVDINAGTSPRITVDWGDATVETFTSTGQKTHTYATAATYTVKICGSFASGGNIRLGSNAANRSRLTGTGIICWIPGLANFRSSFQETGLQSIPTDLFRYNPQVAANGFYQALYGCSALEGAIPIDLFRYNIKVSSFGFYRVFQNCAKLTTAPSQLFKYNILCTNFSLSLSGCTKLQIPSDLFFDAGEEGTRFLNQTVDFANFFKITSFTGTKGTAPALWNCNFGSGTPTKTDAFGGHSTSTLSNYADIPADWT